MIQVHKNSNTPPALATVQTSIEPQLLQRKERFRWQTQHYSVPIKKELDDLYHSKCAFCEQKLTNYDNGQLFTVIASYFSFTK